MACLIDSGLTGNECEYNIGGIKTIYLANKSQVVSITDTDMDGILDDIDMGTSGAVFYKFDVAKNTSSYTTTLTVSGTNKYWLHGVNLQVARAEQDAFDVAQLLGLANVIAIVENKNGLKVVSGLENGLEASAGEINSGVGPGDSAGINLSLTGEEKSTVKQFIGTIPL